MKKFQETGVVTNIENTAITSESIAEDWTVSIPSRPQELRLYFIYLDLYLHPYKVQLPQ